MKSVISTTTWLYHVIVHVMPHPFSPPFSAGKASIVYNTDMFLQLQKEVAIEAARDLRAFKQTITLRSTFLTGNYDYLISRSSGQIHCC